MTDVRKARKATGVLAGILLLISALAHAVFGWPAMAEALDDVITDDAGAVDLLGALAVGWHFGSMAMVVFALIVLRIAIREADACSARFIGIGYLVFGVAAWLARDFDPHFLVFVATGTLLAVFSFSKPVE